MNTRKLRHNKKHKKLRIKSKTRRRLKIKNLSKNKRNIKNKKNRIQIGCSKNMKGGGVNPIMQIGTDVLRASEDNISNLGGAFSGNESVLTSEVTDQPLGNNLY